MKQHNMYFCGPVSSANAVVNLIKENNLEISLPDETTLIKNLAQIEQTKIFGTAIDNLCSGMQKFFTDKNYDLDVKYYGFIKVDKKYKQSNDIDFTKLNGQGIINVGIYKKNSDDIYERKEGHYITLLKVNAKDNKLLIADPYDEPHAVQEFKYDKIDNIKVINKSLDETFDSTSKYHIITSNIKYLDSGEIAIINGVILFKIK